MTPQFKIGQKFIRVRSNIRDRDKVVETIIDVLTTTNQAGETVKIRYVAKHIFLSQVITDRDVISTTIARGLI